MRRICSACGSWEHLHALMNPDRRAGETAGGLGWRAGVGFQRGGRHHGAIVTIVHSGQNFISATSLYGGTWALFNQTLAKLGIEVRFFDPRHPETIERLIDDKTRAVYIEAPGNPKNDVPDFERITDLAHRHGLPAIIDNTVLTPALFRPIEHGFDIVVYSTTKFLGGHGVHLGGAIVDSGNFPWAKQPAKWPEFTEPDRPITAWCSRKRCAHRQHCLHHPCAYALAARQGQPKARSARS